MRSKPADDDYEGDEEDDDIDDIHPVDDLWTPALVGKALVAALKLAAAVAGKVGPKGYGSAMPAILRDFDDIMEWPKEDIQQSPRRMTAATVSKIEDALDWQTRYPAQSIDHATALKVWLRCKLGKRRFGDECKRRGWALRTAHWRKDKALSVIAQGLTQDSTAVWRQ